MPQDVPCFAILPGGYSHRSKYDMGNMVSYVGKLKAQIGFLHWNVFGMILVPLTFTLVVLAETYDSLMRNMG